MVNTDDQRLYEWAIEYGKARIAWRFGAIEHLSGLEWRPSE